MQQARTALVSPESTREQRLRAADALYRCIARFYKTSRVRDEPNVAEEVERLSNDVVHLVLDDDPAVGRASALIFASLHDGPNADLERVKPSETAWPASVNVKVIDALASLKRAYPMQLITEYQVTEAREFGEGLHVGLTLRVLDKFPFNVGGQEIPLDVPEWACAGAELFIDAEIHNAARIPDDEDADDDDPHDVAVEQVYPENALSACHLRLHTRAPADAELIVRPTLAGHRLATRRYTLGTLKAQARRHA